MKWMLITAAIAIFLQLQFFYFVYLNYRYSVKKFRKRRVGYSPKAALIVPCKGIDEEFEINIASFYTQDYENYLLYFVVRDTADDAYSKLQELKNKFAASSKAKEVRILVAGDARACGQKVHNLLYCVRQLIADVKVLAFADSDVCANPNWLSSIVYPLRKSKTGASTGYRWLVPKKNNLATLALSALNAKVTQLLGNSPFNHAWGGSMAIGVDTFVRLGIEKIWAGSVSDDLALTWAVKKAGLKIAYVPACLAATYQQYNWGSLFEFARRQYLITRINAPVLWWVGLFGTLFNLIGQWAFLVLPFSPVQNAGVFNLILIVAAVFWASEFIRAILRQNMAIKILEKDRIKIFPAAAFDVAFCWLLTILNFILLASSAFGRTIRWRGFKYKLVSPDNTVVLAKSGD